MRSTPVKSVQSLVSLLSLAPLLSPPPSEAQSRHCLLPWRADCDVTPHPAPLPSLLLPSLTPHWHSLSWPALSLAPLLSPPPSEAQSRHCLLPWRADCDVTPHPVPLPSLLLPSITPHWHSLSWPALSLAPLLIPPPSEAQSRHCLLPWRGRQWCHAPPPAPLFSLLLPSLSPHRCSLS